MRLQGPNLKELPDWSNMESSQTRPIKTFPVYMNVKANLSVFTKMFDMVSECL